MVEVEIEEWLPYKHDERVHVSNMGRIRGVRGDIRKLHPNKDGLLMITLPYDGRSTTLSVSRVVLETWVGPCPEKGWLAAHKNKVISDNRVCNLEWQPPEKVQADTTAMGRHSRGSDRPCAILDEEKVEEIRLWWECDTYTMVELSKMYGVSEAAISNIINRKSWKHVL